MNQSQQTIEPWLRGIIRCPQCKGELVDATADTAGETASAADPAASTSVTELRCGTCHLAYPVEGGVPVLLVDLARRTDG
ncbi:Trm112 family protein [Terrabacter carboxydivorans]|uniref:Trm112 family protein n=1 Tax=Terrabacter carboxydivorans TaxID=619730 RepID=A0ABP5Z740_9MICO